MLSKWSPSATTDGEPAYCRQETSRGAIRSKPDASWSLSRRREVAGTTGGAAIGDVVNLLMGDDIGVEPEPVIRILFVFQLGEAEVVGAIGGLGHVTGIGTSGICHIEVGAAIIHVGSQ